MAFRNWFSGSGRVLAVAGLLLGSGAFLALRGQQPEAPGQPVAPGTQAPPAAAGMPAAVAPEDVVLTVGDLKFTAAEFETIASALPPQFRSVLANLGKKGFADQLANLLTLALEGAKRQLDQTEEFRRMVEFDRRVLLAQLTMAALGAEVGMVSAEEVGYYFESHQAEFEQAKVTAIYIPFAPSGSAAGTSSQPANPLKPQLTEQQAQRKALELRSRINAGENMATLAKTESDHPTASKGGDLGYVSRGQFTPQIANAIFALQPKRVSAPVRDRFGFFLFRVEEKRVQPLEEVQQGIRNSLGMEKMSRSLEKLKETYPITLNPNYFPETQPAAPAAPLTAPQR